MGVEQTIRERFSVRSYRPDPVSEADLMAVLESARLSQSAKNLQDWRFVVVRNESTRKKLAEAAKGQRFVAEAPVVIACCGFDTGYVMTCGQKSYVIDVAIAIENMALTAHERGLGTCWLGAFYEDQAKSVLGISSPEVRVVGLITLGYSAATAPGQKRKPIGDVVAFERW